MLVTKNLHKQKRVLKDLIETNIRQRGIGNPNPIKLAKCLKELDRILDFKSGNNQYSASEKFSVPITQSDYYEGLGIDERTARNYKKLTELVPELQDWVETGILAPTTAIIIEMFIVC